MEVAAPIRAIFAGDLGFHGGNLDYNRLTAGVTLYLPIFQQGALLSLGDGHALQGDGEISGQGLETSLEVEIKGKSLGYIWAEGDVEVMVSGIDNTLDSSLQMATSGMSLWLKDRYGLNDSEIAALLSSSTEYDIAEVVDPRPHVVARIAKRTLAMIKPHPWAAAPRSTSAIRGVRTYGAFALRHGSSPIAAYFGELSARLDELTLHAGASGGAQVT
ncbi:MAG: hypothetical protein C0481_02515 [Phenylobacterium sp.]|uniref:acetamidase/formamidase family protein n=1 Tax=Phenylobacterium sp. TaxID=1871053 RepID=UPI0025F5FC31|nr:acetamidase/formamidase family protein [Phenylobacterium sp.]MBA4010717.1 hypothetical protein [Phenylobacterium sp.]